MEREVGGGIGMGNTCKPMADSFQCMTKPTTIKKKKKIKKKRGDPFFLLMKDFLLAFLTLPFLNDNLGKNVLNTSFMSVGFPRWC